MTNFLEAAISTGITVVKFDILNFHLETIYNSKKKMKERKERSPVSVSRLHLRT